MVNFFELNGELKKAVILTLAYTDQFDFPLTFGELYRRLIWQRSRFKLEPKVFSEFVINLFHQGFLEYQSGYFFLKGRSSLVQARLKRQKYALKQRKDLRSLLEFLQRIPWVKGVVLTGSLAMNAISPSDDSDFLLIVEPRRLWLTRVIVILYAWLKGKRRSWHSEEDNSWCFNMWLDSDHLQIDRTQRSIYTAYEACQADWLWWRGRVAEKFYLQNSWIKSYLPNFWQQKMLSSKLERENLSSNLSYMFGGVVWDVLDYLAFVLQLWYMRPHRTSEKVARSLAFFHPRDTKKMVDKGWHSSIIRNYVSQS
jgi:hypothetical protein